MKLEPVQVVWYPASGLDVGLCVTDILANPLGLHLRRSEGSGDALLWLSDYDPSVEASFGAQSPGVTHLELKDAEARLGIGSVHATRRSLVRGRELAYARAATRKARLRIGLGTNEPGYDVSIVDVVVRRLQRGTRPEHTDTFEVWFSPFESRAMIEHVFPRRNVDILGLVVLRAGASSGPMPHDGQEFFELVLEKCPALRYVVTDARDDSPWNGLPFRRGDKIELEGWKSDRTVRLYAREV